MKDLKEKFLAAFILLIVTVGILTVGYIALEIIKEIFGALKSIFN